MIGLKARQPGEGQLDDLGPLETRCIAKRIVKSRAIQQRQRCGAWDRHGNSRWHGWRGWTHWVTRPQDRLELRAPKRLGQVGVHSGCKEGLAIARHCARGKRHNARARSPTLGFPLTDQTGGVGPREHGHLHIHQHQIEPSLAHGGKGRSTVFDKKCGLAQAHEHPPNQLSVDRVVIGHQNRHFTQGTLGLGGYWGGYRGQSRFQSRRSRHEGVLQPTEWEPEREARTHPQGALHLHIAAQATGKAT